MLSKFQLMTSKDTQVLTKHITPYFKCLEPFLLEWRSKIATSFDQDQDEDSLVQHADVLDILNRALVHIRTNNTTNIGSSDVDLTTPETQNELPPPQAAQKRAKRPIPPSDRQLRSRNLGVSLGETLAKRAALRKRGAGSDAGVEAFRRKRSAG